MSKQKGNLILLPFTFLEMKESQWNTKYVRM